MLAIAFHQPLPPVAATGSLYREMAVKIDYL
jgi:hypothetical protein